MAKTSETEFPYVTGFCGTGSHEGTRPKSPTGKPMKTCPVVVYSERGHKEWKCECKCHADLDKLFQMSGMNRVIQENPEYIPEKVTVILPTLEERAERFSARGVVPAVVVQSPLPDRIPATIERSFAPNDSGRAGRGELELWVKQACDAYMLINPESACTPAWVSESIARDRGIKPPSVGAISAVFERWSTIDYALVGKKPVRFVGYTPDGVKYGLEGLKDRYKRNKGLKK